MPSFIVVLTLLPITYALNLLELCQSGIRDDGSNYVHCARKSLSEVPAFSSYRFFNLAFDELILSDNAITHINANAFNGLRIKHLVMSGNRLKSIDRNAFRELANYLEQLTLEFDGTIVDRIPEAIQTNLANIRSLTLTGLNLRILPSSTFEHMKKLESLSLKSCNLQMIDDDAFYSIEKQLKHLYLDQNQLDERIYPSIQRLVALETLSLSQNRIAHFEANLVNKNLRYLDLSYNGLTKLALKDVDNLQILNVQNNLLISEQIFGMIPEQLKELVLDFNAIRLFKSDFIPRQNSLETLSIQSNEFVLNDGNIFQYLTRLKRLNLARNNIKRIPNGLFNSTRSLEHLNLDRNPLISLSTETFVGLEQSLKNFSCQSCSLTSRSIDAFSRLNSLQRLKLQSNQLTEIENHEIFQSMSNLIAIDLQRNQLTRIPSRFPSTLRELELANNQLANLPMNNLSTNYFSQLTTLDLSSNPLHCDCQLKPIHRWLITHFQAELVPYVQWMCSSPTRLAGKKLGTLQENEFICDETTTTVFTTEATTTTVESTTEIIPSFNVWLRDTETAILEWSNVPSSFKLIVYENNYKLPILYLNASENYFLLEKLKSSTNYSLCLLTKQHNICRKIRTPMQQELKSEQKLLSLSSSKSIEKTNFVHDIQFLITGIACGILVILLILLLVVVFFVRQRLRFPHASKTMSSDSYYQTTGSDTTHIGGSCSLDDHSTNANTSSTTTTTTQTSTARATPIFYYCRSQTATNCCSEQQPYHFYHEIPFQSSCNHVNPPCLCRTPIII